MLLHGGVKGFFFLRGLKKNTRRCFLWCLLAFIISSPLFKIEFWSTIRITSFSVRHRSHARPSLENAFLTFYNISLFFPWYPFSTYLKTDGISIKPLNSLLHYEYFRTIPSKNWEKDVIFLLLYQHHQKEKERMCLIVRMHLWLCTVAKVVIYIFKLCGLLAICIRAGLL